MLYSKIKFRNLELKNRWVMSPMCMYSATDGVPQDFHLVHYGSRASGGVGLIIAEATAVEPEGRITPKCTGIWNTEQAKSWKRITDFVHQNSDTKIGIQLAHAGRKASNWNGEQLNLENGGWKTVGPSAISYKKGEVPPHELSKDEIKNITEKFKLSAQLSIAAGFDVIEIHAAHGYLLHQFLSPLSNNRTDEYGGNLENRCRFLLEVVDAINTELNNETPIFVRISATDYTENAWDVEQSIALSKMLKQKNVDLIDVSSGGNFADAKITLFDGYQIPFSSRIKNEAEIKTGAVGLINSAEFAEKILQNGDADLIFVARELLRNPYLPAVSSWEMQEECFFPHQYLRGKK